MRFHDCSNKFHAHVDASMIVVNVVLANLDKLISITPYTMLVETSTMMKGSIQLLKEKGCV